MAVDVAENPRSETPGWYRPARLGLAVLTALLTVNLYTGAPLLAIWVGSQVQGGTGLTMSAVAAVLGVLAVAVTLIVIALVRVESLYKFLSGEPVHTKRISPWMRSLRDERPELAERRPMTGFEKTLIAAVVVAALAFEVWFFFFAGSSIG